ncbi:phage neck terminator protein [Formicincola oecophyllae]|uniref:phage neck terminator protein n=1 Tax=Formicincola oecophyllae TaxID=2558361 RepID=UPI00143D6BF4|nr:hypothetical protein [Formicincola oecophyllae]
MVQSSSDTPNTFPLSNGPAGWLPTDSALMTALGDWLCANLPPGHAVMQGQQNNVATPTGPFATMVFTTRQRLGTNWRRYQPDGGSTISQSVLLAAEVQVCGPESGAACAQIQALWRDGAACAWFNQNLPCCAPTHADQPSQKPLLTAEQQYEDAWSVVLFMNVVQSLALPGESALSAHTAVLQADGAPGGMGAGAKPGAEPGVGSPATSATTGAGEQASTSTGAAEG